MLMNNSVLCQGLEPQNYTAIYARHSNIDDKNASNQFQISQCTEVASKFNLIVYKSYEDEGSGFTIPPEKREGFKQLLLDAKAGYFKSLIIWKIDRLWRQSYDYPKTKNLLESLGVNLIFSDMLEFQNMNPIYKNFMTNMFLSIAELEPNKIREKVIAGKNYKRTLGIVFLAHKNFGYKSEKDNAFIKRIINNDTVSKSTETYYVKEPIEAAFINSCFKIYKTTSGNYSNRLNQIKKEMNTLYTLLKHITVSTYKDTIKSIPDKSEFLPIKDELTTLKKNLSGCTSKDIQLIIKRCCTHCSKSTILQQMLTNHHYCGINVIRHENNINLLTFDEKKSCYILNDELCNKAINIDSIVDKELWFEVATHILNHYRLLPDKTTDIFSGIIKCGKCKSKLELNGDLYQCPKCSLKLSIQELKNKIIEQLVEDNILDKIMEQINSYVEQKDAEIKVLENEIKNHEKNCAKYALEYATNSSKNLVNQINSVSGKSKEIKIIIVKLQQDKETYIKTITKQLFENTDGVMKFKENMENFFLDEKSKTDDFLKSNIKGVTVIHGKIQTKYSRF